MTLGRWIGLLSLVVSLYVLWQIRAIVLLFFMAIIFAVGLNRIVRQFQKSRLKRSAAIGLTIASLIVVLGLLLTLVATRITEQVDQLVELIPGAIARVANLNYWLQEQIPGRIIKNLPNLNDLSLQLQQVANWTIIHFYQVFSNSLSLLLNSLLLTVLTLMLLVNPKQYRDLLIQGFPAFYRKRADSIISKCEVGLINYLGGIALSMAFIGIASTVGLLVLQVPLPFVNGFIAGISAFVPYLGAIASVVPSALLALLDSPWKAIEVLLLYFLIQQVEGNLITPIIMKQQVSLLAATTLALLTAFGTFFGVLGLFLGLPILVVAQIWLKEVWVKDILDRWTDPQEITSSHVSFSAVLKVLPHLNPLPL